MDRRTSIVMLAALAGLPAAAAAAGNVAEAFAAALSAHDLKAFAALFAEDYAAAPDQCGRSAQVAAGRELPSRTR